MTPEIENFKTYLTKLVSINKMNFELVLDYIQIKNIKKGDYFIKANNICSHVAYIHQGIFRIYYLKNGNEVNTCFCIENSMMSSFESFIKRSSSQEYIQALEDAVIVTISYEGLMKLYEISKAWQQIGRLLTEKECLRLSNRAASLSFETALEKYQNLLKSQPQIIQRVSVQDIASYLGVSRETLSRIRSKIT